MRVLSLVLTNTMTHLKLPLWPLPQPVSVIYHTPVSSQLPHHIGGSPWADGHHQPTEVDNDFGFEMVVWEKLGSGCVAACAIEDRRAIVKNRDPRSEEMSDIRLADVDDETVADTVEDTPS